MKFYVIIPARQASTRLPGKMLADIHGRPLLQYTYEKAVASGAARVIVATDSHDIQTACAKFGAEVCMTSPAHLTGTDRIAEAARLLKLTDDVPLVNLQGDEPGMPPEIIQQLAEALLSRPDADMTTACVPLVTIEEIFEPNIVKVVKDHLDYALYFSRAPIPWDRAHFKPRPTVLPIETAYFRHLGIYAFYNGFLQRYVSWQPSPLEKIELLEQLRALYYGAKIHLSVFNQQPPVGVDTAEDLQQVRKMLASS